MKLGKIVQPSIAGTSGGATTLIYVVLIVTLWLSITGRITAVKAALAATPGTGGGISGPKVPASPGGGGGISGSIPGEWNPNAPYTPPIPGGFYEGQVVHEAGKTYKYHNGHWEEVK